MIAEEPRLTATALQTVGSKGWDGFTIAIVSDRSQASRITEQGIAFSDRQPLQEDQSRLQKLLV